MNIIHVLSHSIAARSPVFTGADKYVLDLAAAQIAAGHRVMLVGDHLAASTPARFCRRPIGDRHPLDRIRNVAFLRRLARNLAADVVHGHSRAASWAAHFAVRRLGVAQISTVHGRQKLHLSTRGYDIYGDLIIAVCENVRDHLVEELGIDRHKIVVIPNGLQFPAVAATPTVPSSVAPTVAIVGRTTGEKGKRTAALLAHLVPRLQTLDPTIPVVHAGGDPDALALAGLAPAVADKVEFLGYVRDVPALYARATVVIGSGRVAIEALARGLPTFALGESAAHGLITAANLAEAIKSNFGDIVPYHRVSPVDYPGFVDQICALLASSGRPVPVVETVRHRYNIASVNTKVAQVCRRANLLHRFPVVPVLLYHRFVRERPPSRHRTWVFADQFARQLRFLQRWGFTTLTFRDCADFSSGRRSLAEFPARPIVLTFDDGYLDNYDIAWPLLRQYGFTAVIYAMGGAHVRRNEWDIRTGEPAVPLLEPAQIREMAAAGIEFGAHTINHPDLTALPRDEAIHEIAQSKRYLEALLGREVVSFAYPYGRYNEAVATMVEEAGFHFGIATNRGGVRLYDQPFAVSRVHIFPRDRLWEFFKKTSPLYTRYMKAKRDRRS